MKYTFSGTTLLIIIAVISIICSFTIVTPLSKLFSTNRPAAFLNGALPASSPSVWTFRKVKAYRFAIPRIKKIPDTNKFIILDRKGRVVVSNFETFDQKAVLDLKSKIFNKGDAGVLGVAFHPEFNDTSSSHFRELFIYYTYKFGEELPMYDRLSRFRFSSDLSRILPESEQVVMQQADRQIEHNGGEVFFGKEGFLYVTMSDEGIGSSVENTQKINNRLFSGILRIDVDFDSSRSHPIRRIPNAIEKPEGYPGTVNNYMIPNDNPFLNENGEVLEEFYAIGLRSPHSAFYDSLTGDIWVGDVGGVLKEELTVMRKGSNGQWPYREGSFEHFGSPPNLIGSETPPIYDYDRDDGAAVMAGLVYRGEKFPALQEKFIFGDWVKGEIWAFDAKAENKIEVLGTGISGVVDFATTEEGDIYAVTTGGNLFILEQKMVTEAFPEELSEIGVFEDMTNLDPIEGVLPYEVNAPFWSDGALKRRWISLPDDSKIGFNETSKWTFPIGTVFIKHFDIQINSDSIKKNETRFFVVDENERGYGITYKWNEEDTDATLVAAEMFPSDTFLISPNHEEALSQVWDYPTRGQCIRCHNESAGYVLGVNTGQINKSIAISGTEKKNQIEWWHEMGLIDSLTYMEAWPELIAIDDTSQSLEVRVKSYLESNCSSCHNGSLGLANFDARFSTPLDEQGIIGAEAVSVNSALGNLIIGDDTTSSEIWVRTSSLSENEMPPVGKNLLDTVFLDVLHQWIQEVYRANNPLGTEVKLLKPEIYPNPVASREFTVVLPTSNMLYIRMLDLGGKEIPIEYDLRDTSQILIKISEQTGKGVYMLNIFTRDGESYHSKLIVDD